MTEPDPIFGMIATMFHDLAVVRSRGGYTLTDPHSGTPLARLKPIRRSDRFELFYWSEMRGRWHTFGDFGHSGSPSSVPMRCSAPTLSFIAASR